MKDKQINLKRPDKGILVKLPDELWLAAKVKAAQNRMGLSPAIRNLLREWVAEERLDD